MILETLLSFSVICWIVGLFCVYMIMRNLAVYTLRNFMLQHIREACGTDNFAKLMKIYNRYSYNRMMIPTRTIKSYRTELLIAMLNVILGKGWDERK